MDNPFDTPISGQASWDDGLSANFQAIERGYHITERAGQGISSGQVLTLNSGGFFFPYNPASAAIAPHAYTYTAAASGDSLTALAWGIVRSLDINSPAVPGKLAYSTASGFLSTAVLGLPVGVFTMGRGVLFNPDKIAGGGSLAALTDVNTNGVLDGKVLTWADVSSKWVPVAPVTGRTQVGSMDDVLRTAIGNGKILQWSDAASKFVFVTPATGISVGSPPSVVQFTYVRSSNQPTFVTSPSSGNYLVAMGFSNVNHTPAAGWTTYAENISGTDFADIYVKPLTVPGTLVQTPVTASDNTMQIMLFEVQGGKGVTPALVAPGAQNGAAPFGPALVGPAVPNLVDCITLFAMELLSSTSSMTIQYNVTSLLMSNSGTTRQGCAGWSWSDRPLGQHLVGCTSTSGQGKGLALILTS